MKAHIKKGLKKRNERMLENYRLRFHKLFSMINIWKHYIVSYFRIQEELFYRQLYAERNRKNRRMSTLVHSPNDGQENNLEKMNIYFFIEEMFFYMLETMHSTAAMAYT